MRFVLIRLHKDSLSNSKDCKRILKWYLFPGIDDSFVKQWYQCVAVDGFQILKGVLASIK